MGGALHVGFTNGKGILGKLILVKNPTLYERVSHKNVSEIRLFK